MRLVVGIDPGTGKSSPTGLVIFDPDTMNVFYAKRVQPIVMDLRSRLRFIANEVEEQLSYLDEDIETTVYIESFVMPGPSGEMLKQLTGAILTAIPPHMKVMKVWNTTVKKALTGSGKADKQQILASLFDRCTNMSTYMWLQRVEASESWDLADALAIGIAGDMGHGKDF